MMNAVAETLKEPGDLTETLRRITFTARDMVPRADYVSISIRRPDGDLETVAATDGLVDQADELQSSLREGPCYPAEAGARVVYSGNVALDPRWPSYGPQVARLGIASQLAMTLHVEPRGAHPAQPALAQARGLRRLASGRGHLRQPRQGGARVCQEVHTLRAALATRTVMGEAIGIVMRTTTRRGASLRVAHPGVPEQQRATFGWSPRRSSRPWRESALRLSLECRPVQLSASRGAAARRDRCCARASRRRRARTRGG